MNFKELCKMPLLPPPENFPQPRTVTMHKSYDGKLYPSNTDNYNYQAEITEENMLIITVYYGDKFAHRIFFEKENWLNQLEGNTSPSKARITSYNVCYTKLLRFPYHLPLAQYLCNPSR